MGCCKVFSFQAVYHPELSGDEVKVPCRVVAFVNDLIVKLLKVFIYPAASIIKNQIVDEKRVEWARQQLGMLGGEPIALTTPDGDTIDGMYLSAKCFQDLISQYCDLIETDEGGGLVRQTLRLKAQWCERQERSSSSEEVVEFYMQPKKEVEEILGTIKGVGLDLVPNALLSKEPPTRGVKIDLGVVWKEQVPVLKDPQGSHPTVIISPGSGMSYAAYKGLAAIYLIRGINVTLVDFRGYGKSEGSPTDFRTKLDLETVYQYLCQQHELKNEDLLVHGHCLGGGAAADLAARRPGVNLLLDRTFADYREVARERFPIVRKLIYAIMPWIVNYNNAENLSHVKGSVAIAMAVNDVVIPEEQIIKLIDHLPSSEKGKQYRLLDATSGHTGLWTENAVTTAQFDQFLMATGMRFRLF